LLKIFDRLLGLRIEGAGDIGWGKHFGHYKYALKSPYVLTSRADAESWAIIHILHPPIRPKICDNNPSFQANSASEKVLAPWRKANLPRGIERKSRNYLVAEWRKSEKGYRLNYENTYA
jgi:hypothetical protein